MKAELWGILHPMTLCCFTQGWLVPSPLFPDLQCSLEVALRIEFLPSCGTKVQRSATLVFIPRLKKGGKKKCFEAT